MIDFLKGTVTPRDWAAVAGILGATAAMIIAFYILMHLSQKSELVQVQTDDKQVYGDLLQARRINSGIDALREETKRTEKLVSEFEERLPSRREIPTLLKEFEAMAAQEDIDVELSPLSRSKDTRKETIPYSIVARGTYHQVASFINRLERFKRYLKISDLNIGRSVQGVTTARFTLNTYRFLQTATEEVS
ncbi:MAG: type 4a pilus biogenesis protein PilO [Candidatus Hydrogenedentes bacterium]|nr:type 4a pilus biogenesis protein PilO [Candidatus Hydrogenedentota bacterium]